MTTELALSKLTDRQRLLIQLRDHDKLKWREVAEQVGVAQNYAMRLHKEAREKLNGLVNGEPLLTAILGEFMPMPSDPAVDPVKERSESKPKPAKRPVLATDGVRDLSVKHSGKWMILQDLGEPEQTHGIRGSISAEKKAELEAIPGVSVVQHTICDTDPPFTDTTAVVVGQPTIKTQPVPKPTKRPVLATGVAQKRTVAVTGVAAPSPGQAPLDTKSGWLKSRPVSVTIRS